MNKSSEYKTVIPTFNKIELFRQQKQLTIKDSQSKLNGLPINIWFDENICKFEIDYIPYKAISEMSPDIDNLFSNGYVSNEEIKISFRKKSLDNFHINIGSGRISGELSSLIENEEEAFKNKYLRILVPTKKHSNSEAIENFTELRTDQNISYGSGYNTFEIKGTVIEKCRVGNGNIDYQMIDSTKRINLHEMDKLSDTILIAHSYLYGSSFENFGYLLSSTKKDFSEIDSIQLFSRKKEFGHTSPLYDPHEIRKYKFSDSYFLFPKTAFNNLCNALIESDKFLRALFILFEANQNEHSLSKCILYASCIETLTGLIKIDKIKKPIDNCRFKKSNITKKIRDVINASIELSDVDKKYLIDKKINYINTPTNPDRVECIFKKFNIELPDKFIKALKYRNFYLHGNIPKDEKLGAFDSDNFNRAFELHFIANLLILKYVGYFGFLKNYSAEMEYYYQKGNGVSSEDIILNHPLYYEI